MSFQGEYAAQVLGLGAEANATRDEPTTPAPRPDPPRIASPKKENHTAKFNNVSPACCQLAFFDNSA